MRGVAEMVVVVVVAVSLPLTLSVNFPSICKAAPKFQVSGWAILHLEALHRSVLCRSVFVRDMGPRFNRTAPEVFFSWLLLPVTLKATLLGVKLLTSMEPAETW